MRVPESDQASTFSVSPDALPQAGPSHLKTNGHAVNGGSNGFKSPIAPNGVSKRSKTPLSRVSLPGTALYDDSSIDREEYVRLVIQSLRDVGYTESAATLEAESGYVMETPEVAEFRQCILEGEWADAEVALLRLGVSEEDGFWEAKFLISQQKYLEYLEVGHTTSALQVLRNELAPMHLDPEQLHPLSSLVMSTDAADLRHRAGWDGAHGSSRRRLLVNLQSYIPSSLMIPPRRFSTLLDQARLHQLSQCLYHNASATSSHFSLYSDHRCDRDMFPRTTTTILEVHTDEVWAIEWSHNGRWLASASKDKSVIIWSIETDPPAISQKLTLRDHEYSVGCLAWSLDDTILLSSSEQCVKMWNTQTGICIRTIEAHADTVSALAWVPDGSGFISGSQDCKITLWGPDGKQRDSWGLTAIRIIDLAVTPDFTRLVAVGESVAGTSPTPLARGDAATPPVSTGRSGAATVSNSSGAHGEHQMVVYNLSTKQQELSIALEGQLTSVKISEDSQYALVNHAPDEIHLWDITTGRMARKYTGQRQGRHIIRSCFGGVDGNFVVSGSEDGNVYVWHRDRGVLLEVLSGHGSGSVNSVAWNPRNKQMFASCSDDCTIRLWEATASAPHGLASSSRAADRTLAEQEQEHEQGGKGKGKSREPWDDGAAVRRGSRSTSS
ncbi:WD40 repeat-like protein [Auriscalpium vulgare]|uniref:WD40 repeat-like protein n=1 Tax=Auriscalpium vulgare TaxID=40419 RepID=A0ACB8SDA4_9AGAM|nr:WD40 repeat-like protein [Auriscalpium vulgare]